MEEKSDSGGKVFSGCPTCGTDPCKLAGMTVAEKCAAFDRGDKFVREHFARAAAEVRQRGVL